MPVIPVVITAPAGAGPRPAPGPDRIPHAACAMLVPENARSQIRVFGCRRKQTGPEWQWKRLRIPADVTYRISPNPLLVFCSSHMTTAGPRDIPEATCSNHIHHPKG